MKWVKRLFSPAGLIIIGCGVFLLGACLTWDGFINGLPERAGLVTVEGTVRDVERKSNAQQLVRYELELTPPDKLVLIKEQLVDMHIGENDVYGFKGKTVQALITPKRNFEIWEFRANGQPLLSFGPDKEASARRSRTEASVGLYCASLGLFVFLTGLIALRVRQMWHAPAGGKRYN